MENVPEIFKSKRFWSALVGLVMMVATSLIPELEQHADTLIPAILLVISLLIGGYAAEDYAQAKQAQPAQLALEANSLDLDVFKQQIAQKVKADLGL